MAKLDDLIQQKQQRDEDWKAKKTAEREELGQLSDDAVMHVTSEPGAYLHYLDTQAINPRYSASNVMLAMAQNPDITYINSLEVWNRLGRSVNRDENGMKIRVSDTYVKDGREYHGYKIGRVFDISQTHGKAGVPALSLKDNGTSRSQRMSDAGRGAGTSGDGGAVLKKRRAWLLVCTDRPPTAENGAGSAGAADVVIGGALHEHGSL